MRLSDAIAGASARTSRAQSAAVRRAVVSSISKGGGRTLASLDLSSGGSDLDGSALDPVIDVPVLASAGTLSVGDTVYILRQGSLILILGKAG